MFLDPGSASNWVSFTISRHFLTIFFTCRSRRWRSFWNQEATEAWDFLHPRRVPGKIDNQNNLRGNAHRRSGLKWVHIHLGLQWRRSSWQNRGGKHAHPSRRPAGCDGHLSRRLSHNRVQHKLKPGVLLGMLPGKPSFFHSNIFGINGL